MNYFCIVILSVIYPGLGQIFIKDYKKGIILILIALSVVIIFPQFFWSNIFGFILLYTIFGIIIIFSLVNGILKYRKNKISMKWIIGIILIVVAGFLQMQCDKIGSFQRYRGFENSSSAMTNTILEGEKIIVD